MSTSMSVSQRAPWIMAQSWRDLLFAHWPVHPDALRPLLPPPLQPDTFAGHAWLGVVAFQLRDIHLRGCPPLPGLAGFPEVNLRTYATLDGQPGVVFLSLHCQNRLAIALARPWFHLPYRYARVASRGPGQIDLGSPEVGFRADYAPCGPAALAPPGSLAAWLTERYCYYAALRGGRLGRCRVHHPPWPLQPAAACIGRNDLARPFGLELAGPPLLHYAERVDAVVWPVRPISRK